MDPSFDEKQRHKIESQIREAYGRLVYTFTTHNKMVQRLLKTNRNIKVIQIILSALITGGFLTSILLNEMVVNIVGAIISVVLLALNTYTKDFNLVESAQKHRLAADELWIIREEYVSLLTDFELLEMKDLIKRRDELQNKTARVYAEYPRTDKKSYEETQKALKTEEEQTFSDWEIDVMLPNSIRREKIKK